MNFLETSNKTQQAVNKHYTTIAFKVRQEQHFLTTSLHFPPQAVLGHSESQGEFAKFDQTLLEGWAFQRTGALDLTRWGEEALA